MDVIKTDTTGVATAPMAGVRDHTESGAGILERVYNEYAAVSFRYARALLFSPDDAEDAVAEVFAKLARDIERLERIRDVRFYLLRAARNAAYGILRGRQRRERLEQDAAQRLSLYGPDDFTGLEQAVLEAYADLPPEQREVLALKAFQGLTFREIALVVGKPQNTVSARYRYAIERLRKNVRNG